MTRLEARAELDHEAASAVSSAILDALGAGDGIPRHETDRIGYGRRGGTEAIIDGRRSFGVLSVDLSRLTILRTERTTR